MSGTDYGTADKNTIDPIESTDRLISLFRNCEFSLTESLESNPPSGPRVNQTTQMHTWICPDATLQRKSVNQKLFSGTPRGDGKIPYEDTLIHSEDRWTRGGNWIYCEFKLLDPTQWPDGKVTSSIARHSTAILEYQESKTSSADLWDSGVYVVSDLIVEVTPGITLIDMVSSDGRRGYQFQKAVWASEDRATDVTYHFTSPQYGKCAATFHKNADRWLPIRYQIEQAGNDQAFVSVDGAIYLLKENLEYTTFSETPHPLDRLDTTLEIEYDDQSLPKSIKRTVTQHYHNKTSVATNEAIFNSFRTGGVTLQVVQEAIVPVRDGVPVLKTDPVENRLSWTTRNGEVIKSIDLAGGEVGKSVQFSSTRRSSYLILVTAALLAVAGVSFWISRRRTN